MLIRNFEKKDVPEVENIYDLYWTGDFRENLSRRLLGYVEDSPEIREQGFKYFVAVENGEVVGVAGMRKALGHMKEYTSTSNPVEFYVSAVKYKGRGIGSALREKRIEEAKKLGYTEAVLFSGETHQDSWAFHDNSSFVRTEDAFAPNGEKGKIWRMSL